jgi:RNA recognition motif-containing protein
MPLLQQSTDESPYRQLDLYVSNLDPAAIMDDDDLAKLFRPYGTVIGAKLALNHVGHSLGLGVVRMSAPQEAEYARTSVQGKGELL